MVTEDGQGGIHSCKCPLCQKHPRSSVARDHRAINHLLAAADERLRRLLAGLLAEHMGRGGIARLAQITGLARNTIARGQRELHKGQMHLADRIRRTGAGRKRVEEKYPGS